MSRGFCARLAALAFAAALPACSGLGTASNSPSGGSFTDRFTSTVFGSAATGAAKPETETLECPPIDVRQGASTYAVYGPGERSGPNIRYQGTIGETARECGYLAGTVTMKVGLQGRIIVGPVGGPGRIDVPLRIAVVHEGPNPKTVWTKAYRVSVDIPQGASNAVFEHIDGSISFPRPPANEIDSYVIYAGYDPQAPKEQPKARGRKTRQSTRTQ
jgi:hypothetical protein